MADPDKSLMDRLKALKPATSLDLPGYVPRQPVPALCYNRVPHFELRRGK